MTRNWHSSRTSLFAGTVSAPRNEISMKKQKPTVGRTVIVVLDENSSIKLGGNHEYNAKDKSIAPAIVTAVWGDTCINAKVMGDGPENIWLTSIDLDESEAPNPRTWHWPSLS